MQIGRTITREVQEVLDKVEIKIKNIEEELSQVDDIVKNDLDLLIDKYRKKNLSSTVSQDFSGFQAKHFPLLREKKRVSLIKAKEKFENLKMEIAGVIQGLKEEKVA